MLRLTSALCVAETFGQLITSPFHELQQLASEEGDEVIDAEIGDFTHPTLCDPSVKQTAGYIKVSAQSNYFFWLFESKSDPANDPLIMWLSGGPGCSSQLALFAENGPCTVNKEGTDTIVNPYSWHNNANAMWVDQPAGTGFSTGAGSVKEEAGVATNMYTFLQTFFQKFEQYQKSDFFIIGESYAGHYVPAISHKIWQENKAGNNLQVPLKGIAIGNGLTDPEEQYAHYAEMCHTGGKAEGGHAPGVCNSLTYGIMKAAIPSCTSQIHACNAAGNATLEGGNCLQALETCNAAMIIPYQLSHKNPYDMRIPCEHGKLCYDFDNVGEYLNQADVKSQLGGAKKWTSCNTAVAMAFESAGDWMKNFQQLIPDMLHDGIDVLIYAGDCDYICNWLGNKAWTKKLPWEHSADFVSAPDKEWQIDGKTVAKHRSAANFHFMQVFEAGHMVPMDKPAESLEMVNKFISGNLASNDKDEITMV